MIPGDIGAELSAAIGAGAASGELPAAAAALSPAGTWRPAPAGGPGTYATSLPFALAGVCGQEPAWHAASLAASLAPASWISLARVTGQGYLTVTVTPGHLAGLAARIVATGPASLASGALAGQHLRAAGLPDLTTATSWERIWRSHSGALVARLAQAAGAEVLFFGSQPDPAPASPASAEGGAVPAAVARHGLDAVRYALARTATGETRAIERQLALPLDLSNPFLAVRYAHADAASTLRWAADLGLVAPGPGELGVPSAQPQPQPQPGELALLDVLSWLPERLAAAARRHRPAELAAHLENLAGAWLDCRERCPALPFGGQAALPERTFARLELANAVRIALGAGLRLLGVTAPDRM